MCKGLPAAIPFEPLLHQQLQDARFTAGYLKECLATDYQTFLLGIRHVIEAHGGMSKVARASHLNRENLYRAFSKQGNPTLSNVRTVLNTLGIDFSFEQKG